MAHQYSLTWRDLINIQETRGEEWFMEAEAMNSAAEINRNYTDEHNTGFLGAPSLSFLLSLGPESREGSACAAALDRN